MKKIAEEIVFYNDLWNGASKATIVDNVEKCLYKKHPECENSFNLKMKILEQITDSKKQTVYAWINRSRQNVKVPFYKLCKIAIGLDVELIDLLK